MTTDTLEECAESGPYTDPDAVREYYDPYQETCGRALPLPGLMRQAAETLVGERLSLREAVDRIVRVSTGYRVTTTETAIVVHSPSGMHTWEAIRHRTIT